MIKWRYRKLFRVSSAMILLMLYISTMLASDVMALTCGCCDHEADVHTAFRHVHKCTSSHCAEHDHSHFHECSAPVIKEHHSCNHDHSTEVKLYTQPRVEDGTLRETILLAAMMDTSVEIVAPTNTSSFVYQEFSLPALSAGYGGGESLRAPPAMV